MRKLFLLTRLLSLLLPWMVVGQPMYPTLDAQTLHQLVEQSIDQKAKLLRNVLIRTSLKMDSVNSIHHINQVYSSSFEEKDATSIQYQLTHPAVIYWDKRKFKSPNNLKLCRQYRGYISLRGLFRCRETYFVDLPIYSSDLTTVAIVYSSCSRFKFNRLSSCAGFYFIWKYVDGRWIKKSSGMTYIT